MKKAIWVGQDLWNLLNLDLDELKDIYTQYDKNHLRASRRYWKKKVNNGEVPVPEREPKPVNETVEYNENGETVTETNGWYEVVTKDAEGVAHTHRLYKHSKKTRPSAEELAEVYEPAKPARITPTKRKRALRASKFILVYGDGQVDFRRIIDPITQEQELVPLHNIPMHRIIQQFNAKFKPETTVNLGDFADMSAVSRFDPDSDHFHKTLGPSMQWIHNFYAQMVADNPDAEHVEVDSNHAIRVKKKTLAKMPELHDFYRPGEDYPMMSYYAMANLGRLGIKFVDGYGGAEYVYGEEYGRPPIVFKHGTTTSSNPGGTVAKEARENPEVNVIRGHGHHDEEVRRTMRDGWQLFYKMIGSSCMNDGPVPGYHSAVNDRNQVVPIRQNHQNTFLLIEDFQNGHYDLSTIDVINGRAYFQGEEYDGNEERN